MNQAEMADQRDGGDVVDIRTSERLMLEGPAGMMKAAGHGMAAPVRAGVSWIAPVLAAVTALVAGFGVAPALAAASWYTVETAVESFPGRLPLETLFMICGLGVSAWAGNLLCGALVGAIMPRGWEAAALVGWLPVWLVARMWPLLAELSWRETWRPFILSWAVVAISLATPFSALVGGFIGARWRQRREPRDDAIRDHATIVR